MFIINPLSQHVSGIIMSRTVTFTVHTACAPAPHNHRHHYQCRTPYAAVHTLVLLMMGIVMPETCWNKSLIINIRLVASCWFFSLHPTLSKHQTEGPRLLELDVVSLLDFAEVSNDCIAFNFLVKISWVSGWLALQSSRTVGAVYPSTQNNLPADLTLQEDLCEKPECREC